MTKNDGWKRCSECGLGYHPDNRFLKIPDDEKHICPKCGSTELGELEVLER